MNFIGIQVLRRRSPSSLFYYLLIGLFTNETIYLLLTEGQAIFTDFLLVRMKASYF